MIAKNSVLTGIVILSGATAFGVVCLAIFLFYYIILS